MGRVRGGFDHPPTPALPPIKETSFLRTRIHTQLNQFFPC